MTIADVAIRRPVFTWMIMAALLIFGGIAFKRLGVSQMPDVDFPVVNVNLTMDGAAPEVMEMDVVDPVEDSLFSIQGISSITSSSRTGSANITVEFELNKNIDIAVQEVQGALSRVQRRLPKEVDPASVSKSNPEDQPIMWLTVTSDSIPKKDLMSLVRDRVKDRFSTVNGVSEVFLGGYVDPNLRVWLSEKKLNDYALTVNDIVNTIQQEHAEIPSGRVEAPDKEFNIRTMGEAPTVDEFSQLTISRRGGSPNFNPITLGKVAMIEDGLADVRRASRAMGKPAIGLGIRKQRGVNAVDVANAVKKQIAVVASQLPKGAEIAVRFDTTKYIEESIKELNFTLLLSAALTALVCWLFLGSLSATLNVVLAIPTSIVGSFWVLYWLGFTLNTFTLLGLSLAIGIVVDDAIMILENIVRHREMGKSRMEAAIVGTREVTFAALAATAAIIAIFLPVAFMSGIIGKFFFQFGVTLSVAVGLSLLEALTLTPMRCSQFLTVSERTSFIGRNVERSFHGLANLYRNSLKVVLRHRYLTIFLAILLCVGTFFLQTKLKKEFVPAQDQSSLTLRIQAPIGSSLAFTDSKLLEVEQILSQRPEIEQYFSSVGGFGGGDVNTGMIFVTLKPVDERGINPATKKFWTQQELMPEYRALFKPIQKLKVVIQDLSTAAFGSKRGFPIEFAVRGPEWAKLIEYSESIKDAMEKSGIMTDVDSDFKTGMPEVQVVPDRSKALARGVSVSDIGTTVNAMMGGIVAGKYSKGGHRYDVRVRLAADERSKVEDIKRLKVRNNRGELISLAEVVQIRERPSLQAIARQDRQRAISIYANVGPGSSQEKALAEVMQIAQNILPDGYYAVPSGSAKTYKESFQSLIFALMLGLVVSYMVLASQFNHFVHPITVLVALPFSVSGAFVALLLGGQSLNIYSMIGLILLMGIVKKNSILLVDFTNQTREQGKGVRDALLEACPVRLRPIIMTSVATIVGAIPPALAIGPGAETRIPMALAVIGGVFASTVLTLFVVPCVYTLFAGKEVEANHEAQA